MDILDSIGLGVVAWAVGKASSVLLKREREDANFSQAIEAIYLFVIFVSRIAIGVLAIYSLTLSGVYDIDIAFLCWLAVLCYSMHGEKEKENKLLSKAHSEH
jgi:hypothetical protein